MPLPVAALITGALVAGAARAVVTAIGLGVVTFVGADALLSAGLSSIQSSLGATGTVANFAGMMGLDRGISILIGAMTIRISLVPLKRLMMV